MSSASAPPPLRTFGQSTPVGTLSPGCAATSTPTSGAVTGALSTAAIQSSSATTVAAVGFVASGLLTFPSALGIIFGANIGTTLTGWVVAILGFKLHLGQVVLPVIFVGALLKLSRRGQMALLGQALAGFCLIFIGIEQSNSFVANATFNKRVKQVYLGLFLGAGGYLFT